jgi:pSer/pThr/pTyr-binding forkhead associated (FHA) protein
MAKLIVSRDGEVIENRFLNDSIFTIGSVDDSDLCLTFPGVSRVHARITSVGNDDILEDLKSTNGTRVNGQVVERHILQNDDVIEIAEVQIRYRSHKATEGPSFDRTMIIQASGVVGDEPAQPVGAYALATAKKERRLRPGNAAARVRHLDGPARGREVELSRVLHAFGTAGKQQAIINPRPHGYFLTHSSGGKPTRLNGKPIGDAPQQLRANDVIVVGTDKLLFILK